MPRSSRKASRKPPITCPLLEGGLALGTHQTWWDLESRDGSPAPHLCGQFQHEPCAPSFTLNPQVSEALGSRWNWEVLVPPRMQRLHSLQERPLESAGQLAGEPYQVGWGQWVGVPLHPPPPEQTRGQNIFYRELKNNKETKFISPLLPCRGDVLQCQ